MAGFFRGAARLYRSAPGSSFPEMPAPAVVRSAAVRDHREEKKGKKKRKAERAARKRNR